MVKPNKSVAAPSITSVIKKISDDKALVLFNSIAVSSSHNEKQANLKEMNLSTKQYYSRISGLQNAGLIKRQKGKYSLTLLGHVVYGSQMKIVQALAYYWKLKALETIEMSATSELPNDEKEQLINALIDNHQIKDILLRLISIPSVVSKSKTQIPTGVINKDPIPKYLREERMNRS
jgi:predicted transcriptional regulator